MKRNKEKARGLRSGSSPYAKYAKRPHRYSDALRNWESQFVKREEARNLREEGNARTRKRAAKLSKLHYRPSWQR